MLATVFTITISYVPRMEGFPTKTEEVILEGHLLSICCQKVKLTGSPPISRPAWILVPVLHGSDLRQVAESKGTTG